MWLPGDPLRTFNGAVHAMQLWDPDGAGPVTPKLVYAGEFTIAGSTLANRIAAFDLATGTWSTFGSGFLGGQVRALTVLPGGDLVAGGFFFAAGGVPASCVARWNGSAWSALGAGTNTTVWSLATTPGGDLVAGGDFTTAGGAPAQRVARWNGSTWSAFAPGPSNSVAQLAAMPNGDVITGTTTELARWDGTGWTVLGTGDFNALTALANGDLIAGGAFATLGGVSVHNIARWNGTNWSALGSGASARVRAVVELPNGDLVASGDFTAVGGSFAPGLARWDGTAWTPLPGSPTSHLLAALPNGDLARGTSRWDGATWSPLAGNAWQPWSITCVGAMANGDTVAGGTFATSSSTDVGIAVRSGSAWQWLGTMPGSSVPFALLTMPNGDLIVGGAFSAIGGIAANGLARWDGTAWSALGSGVIGLVRALALLPNGDVVATGSLTSAGGTPVAGIARWDGTAWSPLGKGLGGSGEHLTVLPNGDLIVAGDFAVAGTTFADRIARWDGTAWSALGAGLPNSFVRALAARPDGRVVAAGIWYGASLEGRVYDWNGTNWTQLGANLNAPALALVALPDGDVIATGDFVTAGGVAVNRIARWNGTTWSAIGAGLNARGDDLALAGNGDVLVGGTFTTAGDVVSTYVARLTTTCPASAAATGAGCNGNTLTAATLPWVDATFRATGSGLPSPALVLALTSVTAVAPPFPLDTVLPQALPGCDLLVAPDIQQVLFSTTGTATSELFLPNTPPLVGVTFFHQMVPIEVDGALDFLAITATNALQLTAGQY